MTRGKYSEKAAKRRVELEVTTDLASYQHRVAKLTAENRELHERLAAQERTAKQVERRLRAERDEGVAPQLEALRLQLDGLERKHRERIERIFDAAAAVVRSPGAKLVQSDVCTLAELLGRTWAELAGPGAGSRDNRRTPEHIAHTNLRAFELGYAKGRAEACKSGEQA